MKSPFVQAFSFVGLNAGRGNVRLQRSTVQRCAGLDSSDVDVDAKIGSDQTIGNPHLSSRRSLLHSAGISFAGSVSSGPLAAALRCICADPLESKDVANAMGLVQFPCDPGELMNTYHLMRAGQSGLEAEGILSTNPLFLTNREDALTELGLAQVEEACNEMMARGINPSVVKYSLASKCIDTANVVATKMFVGRNRIVPEFTFMDPRGAGLWDGKPLDVTEAAIWAMDAAEAGDEGRNGKPPPNEDGTANETLFDQVTRLRQLMSILETQYSGDSILLIFPDGTSPALLSCLIAGIPLKDVHALNFLPGELREDVNMDSSLQLLKDRLASPGYLDALAIGKEELVRLRKEHEQSLLAMEGSKGLLITKPKENIERVQPKKERPKKVSTATHKQTNRDDQAELLERRQVYSSNSVDSAMTITGLGGVATMAMMLGKKDNTVQSSKRAEPAPVLAYANSTGVSVFEQQVDAVPVVAEQQSAIRASTNSIPTFAASVVDSNPNVFVDEPVLSKEERIEAFELAQRQYLDQDDGGDAWLSSLGEMMEDA